MHHARLPCPSLSPRVCWNHFIFCCPLILLPQVFSSIRVFSSESSLHIRWPKYWSFSFSISPSNEYAGLLSFRIDWSLGSPRDSRVLSHQNLKSSILWHSAFFMAQVSHLYITTGKTTDFFFRLFLLVGGLLLYNIVVVFNYTDIYQQSDVSAF